jgi:hypothetical protein
MSPISAAIVNAGTHPIPGTGQPQRHVRMVGAAGAPVRVDRVDPAVQVPDQRKAGVDGYRATAAGSPGAPAARGRRHRTGR